ncbi:hypothetical protein AB0K12_46380 [Nonomuraea sp. NPDC049419]|uniref:hypothetical protein n=1 Tax=Nonomuraea sp. NPDC049419 TaxID=3155772 RepID=UPI003420C287
MTTASTGHDEPARRVAAGLGRRPDGLSGVVEIRLHGVGGTSPQSLLDDLAPMQVSGDRIAGFYRTADREGRHVEAYSWGGLTSGSAWRVLWLLLLPFAMANMAARMFPPWLPGRPRRFAVFLWAARVASFGLTLNLVLLAAAIPVDYVAYQCGGVPACARWPAWLLPPERPGVRILVGALVPLLVIAVLYLLAHTSQNRYDQTKPPAYDTGVPPRETGLGEGEFPGLSDPAFWDDVEHTRTLTRLHVAGAVALVAALVTWTSHAVRPLPGPWEAIGVAVPLAVIGLCALALVGRRKAGSWALLAVAGAAMALSAVLAAGQPPGDPFGAGPHELPGLQVFMNGVYAGVLGALFLVPVTLAAAAWTRADWPGVAARAVLVPVGFAAGVALLSVWETDYGWIWTGLGLGVAVGASAVLTSGDGRLGGRFRWGAPFVVLGLAVAALNTFMLATLLLVAEWLGTLRPCHDPRRGGCLDVPEPGTAETPIAVFPIIRNVIPYLIVVPVLLLLCFLLYQGVRWWGSGVRGAAGMARHYRGRFAVPDGPLKRWWASTVDERPVPEWHRRLVESWPARVARARRLARVPRDLDLLLTALMAVGGMVLAWVQWRVWWHDDLPTNANWLTSLCAGIAMLLPFVLVGLLRLGWKDERNRRLIGVLWDVATFWPRHCHPLAPPSYAERAVPELQRRLWWLHDNGGVPLLAAHSQGSVIAAAALAQPCSRPRDDRVTLVTFGSPLRTLYAWGFPAYFNDELFRRLAHGPGIQVARWRNFWCDTDYIGGPVREDVDEQLPDPPDCRFLYGQPPPAIGAHTGFWEDPRLHRRIAELGAGFPSPPGAGNSS